MVNKDTSRVISLEDMETYIHIKTEEDYTYEEAMAMLADGTYKDAPYSFITFIARMIEMSIIGVYPDATQKGDSDGKIYAQDRNDKERFPMYVRYKYGNGDMKILEYSTEYVYTLLNKPAIDNFIKEYQKRVIHKLIDEQDRWIDEELESDLFGTMRWVAMNYETITGEEWEMVMQGRVTNFIKELKEYTELKNGNYPSEIESIVMWDYWVEKETNTKWNA